MTIDEKRAAAAAKAAIQHKHYMMAQIASGALCAALAVSLLISLAI